DAGESCSGVANSPTSSSRADSLRTSVRRWRVMHWLTAIRCSQDETLASPRNPRRFRNAARNVSWVASRASSSRPSIPYVSANMRRSQRRTISPKASASPVKARSTICSSLVAVSIPAMLLTQRRVDFNFERQSLLPALSHLDAEILQTVDKIPYSKPFVAISTPPLLRLKPPTRSRSAAVSQAWLLKLVDSQFP